MLWLLFLLLLGIAVAVIAPKVAITLGAFALSLLFPLITLFIVVYLAVRVAGRQSSTPRASFCAPLGAPAYIPAAFRTGFVLFDSSRPGVVGGGAA